MNILYYTWNEITFDDIKSCLQDMGHSVDVIDNKIKDYDYDIEFEELFVKKLQSKNYDFVFTQNYLPIISNICNKNGIKYISWIYDADTYTTYSYTIDNKCNYIFSFDESDVLSINAKGFGRVYYMPLATNVKRLDKIKNVGYDKDISFLGNLYSNNLFDTIKNLPEYVRGYVDSLINTQIQIWGYDIVEQSVTKDIIKQILGVVNLEDFSENYFITKENIIKSFIRGKISTYERAYYIKNIAKFFKLDLYTNSDVSEFKNIKAHPYLKYNEIVNVYKSSKINFNISARRIKSGIPLRILDIMGSNSFLLTNYQSELSYYFENMKDIVWYDSLDDCIDKIDYLLKNDDIRENIKENGYKKVKENFSYEAKFIEIFDIVFGK